MSLKISRKFLSDNWHYRSRYGTGFREIENYFRGFIIEKVWNILAYATMTLGILDRNSFFSLFFLLLIIVIRS